jgi:hemolysin III
MQALTPSPRIGDATIMKHSKNFYTIKEEIAHSVSHGVGAALSVVGLVVLLVFSIHSGDPWRIAGGSVFGGCLIFCYLSSTLYHALPCLKAKRVMRSFDHVSIYMLIAGTYTPFLLVNLRGPWGWSLFGVVWGVAAVGSFIMIFYPGRWNYITTTSYLAMGWLIVVAIKPTMAAVPLPTLGLCLAGGLAYSVGVIFYLWERLPYHHAIWHLFVLGGSAFHFFAVVRVVHPAC